MRTDADGGVFGQGVKRGGEEVLSGEHGQL